MRTLSINAAVDSDYDSDSFVCRWAVLFRCKCRICSFHLGSTVDGA